MATRQHLLLVGWSQPATRAARPKLDVELVVKLGDRVAAGHERKLGALMQNSACALKSQSTCQTAFAKPDVGNGSPVVKQLKNSLH